MSKTKVAILGGGLGSIAAAYELTSTADLRDRFEVTVYQQGWRLGGKGASGRNAAMHERIEEHGLHAFLGFYENAFALMRDAYADFAILRPNARWKTWRDAFEPQRQVTIEEWVEAEARWSSWTIALPRLPGEPGDGDAVPLVERLVAMLVGLVIDFLEKLLLHAPLTFAHVAIDVGKLVFMKRTHVVLKDALAIIDDIRSKLAEHEDDDSFDDVLRRLLYGVFLAAAILQGLVVDVLPRGEIDGFAYIDQWDFRAWLERNGAPRKVSFWGPVRALYDLGFAYEGGDPGQPSAAAGVSLRILLLLALGYKDAPLWKMKAGMGDTIFGPLYLVLKSRGVKFELFHRVTNLGLSATGALIDRIELSEQVNIQPGGYTALRWVNDLPCWPSEPNWSDIVDGPAIQAALAADELTLESAWCGQSVGTKTLKLGVDFDRVVLGISIGALPDVASELIATNEKWAKAIATSRTVQTQAVQLWLDRTTAELGWRDGVTIMTGYVEPFDTWGDLSHLLPEEEWDAAKAPKSLAYFCNALQDADPIPPYSDAAFPKTQKARVFGAAQQFLNEHIGTLWPRGTSPPGSEALDGSLLHDESGAVGMDRLKAQYWRANVDPTERYVLSPPGSIAFRLKCGSHGFINLVVAGDWVCTSINGGCAEAAVEGGLRAAHALIGYSPRPFVDRHVADDTTIALGD